jgi:hypothetical protein
MGERLADQVVEPNAAQHVAEQPGGRGIAGLGPVRGRVGHPIAGNAHLAVHDRLARDVQIGRRLRTLNLAIKLLRCHQSTVGFLGSRP